MAEIWYLEMGTKTLENEAKHDRPFLECVELLEIKPQGLSSEIGVIPDLYTGDPFVDIGGRITICLRVFQAELDGIDDNRWKPGWYKSGVTVIGLAKKLKLNAK